jgi:hypothetical protein
VIANWTIIWDGEGAAVCRSGSLRRFISMQIYRIAGAENRWSLEVVDEENTSTVWDETFEKDTDAYEESIHTLNREGILTFTQNEPTGTRH